MGITRQHNFGHRNNPYRSEAVLMNAADHNLLTSTETTSHKISVKD